jgi:hypothetical protein
LAAENLKRNVQNHSGVSQCELAGFPASVTRQFSEPNIGKCYAVTGDLNDARHHIARSAFPVNVNAPAQQQSSAPDAALWRVI